MKKENKKTTKVDVKETKKEKVTKVVKKEKTTKVKQEKVSIFKKLGNYFHEVKTEMKKVKWPNKKDMLKYSGATIVFIVIFGAFFTLTDLIIAGLKMLVA